MRFQPNKLLIILLVLVGHCTTLHAQEQSKKAEKKALFRDTLDNKLDLSQWLIQASGFIPIPQIITEPALGSFGMMFTPIFIKPNKHHEKGKYVAPDITAGFAGYTANHTWGLGAMRIATLPQYGIKYRVGGAFGNVNMNYYRDVGNLGEHEFSFNFEMTPVFLSVLKEISNTNIYAGLQYMYMYTKISPKFAYNNLPDFISEADITNQTSTVGIAGEYDARDNIFTPNKGTFISTNIRMNGNWTGSDYNFQNLNFSILQYLQFTDAWVSGFRFETKHLFGKAPFYMEPGVSLRGVPLSRYQGKNTYVVETEQRYDVSRRWSAVIFTGLGKAQPENISWSDADWVYNYGTGFRYLLVRVFKLRMGIDVAWSNNDFGYYLTFGSAWNNRG
ncbi:BamA/TamA family outer membrane protein [Reichenbachiella carrageenanivorans]|uniref:BamA/TamA family outer membrane protein n=1 Tax=Reichenbachiella carrageenanivorans TaxID=2979869 RepID=A0ABY6CUQ2_9BACT|nr:BamA/TamA family outer membrane protein [Reichenbachiella carrageenanivorans]UXX77647.1 BamA/TamA family outer membrane protein [Reichenbachiella carrageenanivorans]